MFDDNSANNAIYDDVDNNVHSEVGSYDNDDDDNSKSVQIKEMNTDTQIRN